ncbi:MAG: O-antigen ligase family protein [Pseudomonadota bacterium]
MKPEGKILAMDAQSRSAMPFYAVSVLIITVFVLGGSSKDYVPGLLLIRPLAVAVLAIGLYHLTREDWQDFRLPLGFMAAVLALIMIQLIPLPPALWMALPGRELAIAAGEAAGIEQPWRPIALVPYRGWNAFYAMLVPAAVMVCAVQLHREQHRSLVYLVLAGAVASAAWGVVQAGTGYSAATYFYGTPTITVPNGLFANRNHMAALLAASLPLFVLIATRAKGQRMTLVRTACVALGVFALMMALISGSRAGLAFSVMSLAASVLVWSARPNRAAKAQRGARKQAWVPFAFAAFWFTLLAGFGLVLAQTTGFERLMGAGSGQVEEFRFVVWQTMIDFMPEYLPFGSGIGSFVEVFKVHEPDAMLATSYWNHAHNDWLEWALEGGIAAMALMAVAVLGWCWKSLALVRNRQTGRIEVQLGLAGAIILFILGAWSFVDYPTRTPALASLMALCAVWIALPEAVRVLGKGRLGSDPGQSRGKNAVGDGARETGKPTGFTARTPDAL